MTSKVLMIFFIIFLIACSSKNEEPYNSKLSIQNEILSKTDIKLDTTKFTVILDSVENTEGAFDSDYTWLVKIKFENNYFENLKKVIKSSTRYNTIQSEFDENWKGVDTSKIKGIWYLESRLYKYVEKPKDYNSEPTQIRIDTLTRKLDLILSHL